MKQIQAFLYTIRQLPEEARKILAVFGMFILTFVVFNIWSTSTSLQLSSIDAQNTVQVSTEEPPAENSGAPETPAKGIIDSIKSIAKILPDVKPQSSFSLLDSEGAVFRGAAGTVENFANGVRHYIADPLR